MRLYAHMHDQRDIIINIVYVSINARSAGDTVIIFTYYTLLHITLLYIIIAIIIIIILLHRSHNL